MDGCRAGSDPQTVAAVQATPPQPGEPEPGGDTEVSGALTRQHDPVTAMMERPARRRGRTEEDPRRPGTKDKATEEG